jgi:hypothetical protein
LRIGAALLKKRGGFAAAGGVKLNFYRRRSFIRIPVRPPLTLRV